MLLQIPALKDGCFPSLSTQAFSDVFIDVHFRLQGAREF